MRIVYNGQLGTLIAENRGEYSLDDQPICDILWIARLESGELISAPMQEFVILGISWLNRIKGEE